MGQRILVVDDEASVIQLLQMLLTREGYDVGTAENGRSALDQVESFNPDLIITDISMPDMEGIEFISLLRKRKRATPVIAMSGNAVGMNFLKATKLFGAVATLTKPFSTPDLLSSVRTSLGV